MGEPSLTGEAVDTQGFGQWQGAIAISKNGAMFIGFGSNIRPHFRNPPATSTGRLNGQRNGQRASESPLSLRRKPRQLPSSLTTRNYCSITRPGTTTLTIGRTCGPSG